MKQRDSVNVEPALITFSQLTDIRDAEIETILELIQQPIVNAEDAEKIMARIIKPTNINIIAVNVMSIKDALKTARHCVATVNTIEDDYI